MHRERDPSCCCQADFDHFLKLHPNKKKILPHLFFSEKMDKNCLRYSLSSYSTDLAQGTNAQIPGLNAKDQNLLLTSPRSLSVDLNPGPEISLLLLCLSGSITENVTIYSA